MIEHLGDLHARIARWIKEKRGDGKPLYEFVSAPDPVVVCETNENGQAHIEVSYPDGAHCVVWHLEKTGYFQFLEGDKAADGIFFVCSSDSRVAVHIIECKKTMTQSNWEQVIKQLQESLSKILAIAGVLGIKIDHVYLGAAFRENRLDADPRWGVVPLDARNDGTPETIGRARELADWKTARVHLRGFAKPFPLAKIQLDKETGRGSYALPNP